MCSSLCTPPITTEIMRHVQCYSIATMRKLSWSNHKSCLLLVQSALSQILITEFHRLVYAADSKLHVKENSVILRLVDGRWFWLTFNNMNL